MSLLNNVWQVTGDQISCDKHRCVEQLSEPAVYRQNFVMTVVVHIYLFQRNKLYTHKC